MAAVDETYIQSYTTWERCHSYADLLAANLAFLKGEIHDTPYHLGPICTETRPILENIKKINERGFLTTGSQPSLKEGDIYLQRSYITGFIKLDNKDSIIDFATRNNMHIKVFYKNNMIWNSFPVSHFCVTYDMDEQGNLHEFTWLQSRQGDDVFSYINAGLDTFNNIVQILQEYAYVEIANSEWNDVEISELLAGYLQ